MTKISKFEMPSEDRIDSREAGRGFEFQIEMPRGARVLSMGRADGYSGLRGLVLWALIDTEAPAEKREFRLFKTHWPVDAVSLERDDWHFVGSASQNGQDFHLWAHHNFLASRD